MTNSTSKIRIKIGTMELDYEGDPSFLNGGIEKLLETMGGLAEKAPNIEPALHVPGAQVDAPTSGFAQKTALNGINFTTSTLANYTDAKTGPDLALCAMAYLQISKAEASCSSSMILSEMKTATGYYKSTMSGNNASNLKALAKSKKINEIFAGKYALSNSEIKRFEAVIARIE
jgi:hypothetical protein